MPSGPDAGVRVPPYQRPQHEPGITLQTVLQGPVNHPFAYRNVCVYIFIYTYQYVYFIVLYSRLGVRE